MPRGPAYKPDFEAMAAYDAWWQQPKRDPRPMVGLPVTLPIHIGPLDTDVAETQACSAQRRVE